tara:strand:- start:6389 stop:7141 length:753 start_codon:yes stop_codon:yes gene_type:complete
MISVAIISILVILLPVGIQVGSIAATRGGGSRLSIQVLRAVQYALAHLADERRIEVAEVFQRHLEGAALVAGVGKEIAGFFIDAPVLEVAGLLWFAPAEGLDLAGYVDPVGAPHVARVEVDHRSGSTGECTPRRVVLMFLVGDPVALAIVVFDNSEAGVAQLPLLHSLVDPIASSSPRPAPRQYGAEYQRERFTVDLEVEFQTVRVVVAGVREAGLELGNTYIFHGVASINLNNCGPTCTIKPIMVAASR